MAFRCPIAYRDVPGRVASASPSSPLSAKLNRTAVAAALDVNTKGCFDVDCLPEPSSPGITN